MSSLEPSINNMVSNNNVLNIVAPIIWLDGKQKKRGMTELYGGLFKSLQFIKSGIFF